MKRRALQPKPGPSTGTARPVPMSIPISLAQNTITTVPVQGMPQYVVQAQPRLPQQQQQVVFTMQPTLGRAQPVFLQPPQQQPQRFYLQQFQQQQPQVQPFFIQQQHNLQQERQSQQNVLAQQQLQQLQKIQKQRMLVDRARKLQPKPPMRIVLEPTDSTPEVIPEIYLDDDNVVVDPAVSTSTVLLSSAKRRKLLHSHGPDPGQSIDQRQTMYTCTEPGCGITFQKSSQLIRHMDSHEAEEQQQTEEEVPVVQKPYETHFDCTICVLRYDSVQRLHVHQKYHHEEDWKDLGVARCEDCGGETVGPAMAQRHKELLCGVAFKCPVCEKGFKKVFDFRRHVLAVHKKATVKKQKSLVPRDKYRCPLCPASFKEPTTQLLHIEKMHKGEVRSVTCPLCPVEVATPDLLTWHVTRKHAAEKTGKAITFALEGSS